MTYVFIGFGALFLIFRIRANVAKTKQLERLIEISENARKELENEIFGNPDD